MDSSVATRQLEYEKLTSDLLQHEALAAESRRAKSKTRWSLFLLGLLFFILSKMVMLRTEFAAVFKLFESGNGDAQLACLWSNEAKPWNIVLNVAYPWLGKVVNQQPLSQDQADFLWNAIRFQYFPTQDQIDSNPITKGLKLTPLSYLCGNIMALWTGHTIDDVIKDPVNSPWGFFLTPKSSILTSQDGALNILLTQGFWGIAKYMGSGSSPKDMYTEIFAQQPPPPGCDSSTRFASIASSAATFSMAGAAFGPEGAAIGGIFGLGLGLSSSTNGCGGGGACTIM